MEYDLNLLYKAEKVDKYQQQIFESKLNRISRYKKYYKPSSINRKKPFIGNNIYILWMDKRADNGLPHTRYPNIICLPENISKSNLKTIILHESVHITQKLYPKEWENIFKKWDMKVWNGYIPQYIKKQIRINPDTVMAPLFIWKNKWVILGIFESKENPDIRKIKNIWLDITNNNILYIEPKEWIPFFGNINGEHPYEIASYYITYPNNSMACDILIRHLFSY